LYVGQLVGASDQAAQRRREGQEPGLVGVAVADDGGDRLEQDLDVERQ
jgi:hypothetical protein